MEMEELPRDATREQLLDQLAQAKAEAALLRDFALDTDDLLLRLRPDGRITYVNPSCERFLGLEAQECLGLDLLGFIHPGDQKRAEAALATWSTDRTPFAPVELRLLNRSGQTHFVRFLARRHEASAPTISIVAKDVTACSPEGGLLNAPALLNAIVENIPDMIFVKDAKELRFVLFNKAGEKLLGFPRRDMIGKNDYDFFTKEKGDYFTEMDRETLASKEVVDILEEPITIQSGEVRLLHTKKVSIRDEKGTPLYLLGISEDITDLKRLAQELGLRERQLSDAQRIAHIGSWEWEIGPNLVTWSDELFRIFDLPPREFKATFEAYLERVHPEDRAWVQQLIMAKLAERQGFTYECRIVLPDGRLRTISVKGAVVEDERHEVIRMMGTVMDITERKLLEGELKTQYEKLKELDRLKSNFVNAVTHELRTPLTSIMGYAEFLEDGLGGPLSEQQREFVRQIERGTRRLESLVSDLLDFARIDAGTFKLKLQDSDLGAKIQEIVESLRPQAEGAKLSLEAEVLGAPLRVPMDSQRIGQVLINLLNNAIKFTPQAGSIRVKAYRQGESLRCEVEDTGEGIAPEDLPRLFQRFSQLESGVRRGGTGLGLSIIKEIVQAHGGSVGVESEQGKGSTFWFTLPLQGPAEGAAHEAAGGPERSP